MQTQLPCRLCADAAIAVAHAENLTSACEAIVSALFNTLLTESAMFQMTGSVCTRLAGPIDATTEQTWRTHLTTLPPTSVFGLLGDQDGTPATYVAIGARTDQRLFLVIEDDWTHSEEVLLACAEVISVGLDALPHRAQARQQNRLLVRSYRFLRELSRARGSEAVAKVVARHVGSVLDADRVSVARYDEHEDRLRIAATRGLGAEVAGSVSVRPGDWVLGHVHQSGKPLIVNEPAQLPAGHHHRTRYRPGPFAVIPIEHNRSSVGVLAVTDKRVRAPFTPLEQFALRALAPVIGAVMSAAQREEEANRLRYAATVDSLTGLHNRAYLDRRLHEEVGRSRRESNPLTVLMVDIDDFKVINDARGHAEGDAVLKHVGDVIRSAVRVFDVCARYGGDEFVIVMPNSDAASALACAERIRTRTEQSLDGTPLPRVTLSVGVATALPDSTPTEVLARADRALYAAKAMGKNAVRIDGTSDRLEHQDASIQLGSREGGAELPYILVADRDRVRMPLYRRRADQSQVGMLVARDGNQALRVMEQFGPPSLLVIDMTAPEMQGVSLVEWLQGKSTQARILAFSPSSVLRRYFAANRTDAPVTIIRPEASPSVIEAALTAALEHREAGSQTLEQTARPDLPDVRTLVSSLAPKVRRLIDASGVGVYLKDPEHERLHSGVSWTSDALLSRVHAYVPRVAERVIDSGEPVLIGQVGSSRFPAPEQPGEGHSLVAVPMKHRGQVVGAVCAFNDGPLALADNALTEFERLGECQLGGATEERVVTPSPPAAAPGMRRGDEQRRVPADVSDRGMEWQPTLLERQRGEFEVARELARARSERQQLSVVLFDVSAKPGAADSGGDYEAVASVADTFVRVVRPSDLPIRWSGSELLLVLPGVSRAAAHAVAERVRAAMQAGARHRVAVSGGVAEAELNEQFGNVVSRARERVMIALSHGHNRVG